MSHPVARHRAATLAGSLLLIFLTGFAWFAGAAFTRPVPRHPQADGLVALTGGAERIATALRLLAAGRARALLISGVGGEADLADFVRLSRLGPRFVGSRLAARVTLGRSALSTRGNATETAAWVAAHRIHSLIVVTAWYHMPRALAEMDHTLRGVTLIAYPVHPAALRHAPLTALRLLAQEYVKYLVVEAGISGLVSRGTRTIEAGR